MHKNLVVFDIETAPLPLAELSEPQFEPRANLKDPAKIAADIEEKRARWKDKLALCPTTGKVLAWGYLTSDGGGGAEMEHGHNEKQLLANLFKEMNSRGEYWWVGHNIFGFDIPFLIKRAWKLGLDVPSNMLFLGGHGPQRGNFIDTMWWWAKPEKPMPGTGCGLDAIARFLGVGEKNGDGRLFSQLYETSKDDALAYLANDLRLTMAVARRMGIEGDVPVKRGE